MKPYSIRQWATAVFATPFLLISSLSWAQTPAPTICTGVVSPDITIAVASNFYGPAQELVAAFTDPDDGVQPGKTIKVCHNATKLLKDEINATGSPYSLFLAANDTVPGLITVTTSGGSQTYAKGIPVLYSVTITKAQLITTAPGSSPKIDNTLVKTLAIADPDLAPYGKAAEKILKIHLNQWNTPHDPPPDVSVGWITKYPNVGLTYANTKNGKNDAGFVSKGQVCKEIQSDPNKTPGVYADFPSSYYLTQNGILINRPSITENLLAKAFFDYLLSAQVQNQLKTKYCYAPIT